MTGQHPTMIKLPLISFDRSGHRRIKKTWFSSALFGDKLIRDFEDKGNVVPDTCVAAKQLKLKSEFSSNPEEPQGEYWTFALSADALVKKLQSVGFGVAE